MKIKYLGTSGGDGVPALFCECYNCTYARKRKGKNIRTTQQAVIDGKVLIDIGPDTFTHSIEHNVDFSKIEHCIITHSHKDHFYQSNILMRKYSKTGEKLNVYATAAIIDGLKGSVKKEDNVELKVLEYGEEYFVSKYKIVPLKANHGSDGGSAIYLISDGINNILYCHDTGEIFEEVYGYLKNKNMYLDFVTLDCTCGFDDADKNQHMNVQMCETVRNRLFEIGCADNNTLFYLSHFSHNHEGALYDTFISKVKPYGFIPAYDGLEVKIDGCAKKEV